MNYSDKATEQRLHTLEANIAKNYHDAYVEISREASNYFANFKDRYNAEYAAFVAGEGGYNNPATAQQKFNSWYLSQVGRGERWEDLRDRLASRMTEANRVASAYINDATPGIYSLNANYAAYEIWDASGVDFNLVDAQTVRRLMEGNKLILPPSRVSIPASDKWNSRRLTNALTSGILQGRSIDKIATSFQEVTNMGRTEAIRNARTAVTGAQNSGRQETYYRAAEMGIEIKKEWIATQDDRTRESHAELDGVQVNYSDDFPNGLQYPGDPRGAGEEVYNCRCTMRAIIPKYNGQQRESQINGHEGEHTRETYSEWETRKEHEAEGQGREWTSAAASARAMEAAEDRREAAANGK